MELSIYKNVEGYRYAKNAQIGEVVKVSSLQELEKIIIKDAYSPFIYTNNLRKSANFIRTNLMVFDFDGGVTLEDVSDILLEKNLDHSLTLTKSHRIKKLSGTTLRNPEDRFRLIIPLSKPIKNETEYRKVWTYLYSLFPQADSQCKDLGRFYFASVNGTWKRRQHD